MSDFLKSRLAAAEMRHELDMRQKGYVITRNGRPQWKQTGKPFRQRPSWHAPAIEVAYLLGVGLVVLTLLSF